MPSRREVLSVGLIAASKSLWPMTRASAVSDALAFPEHPLDEVREMVLVAHGDAAAVRELLRRRPGLCRATIDWGFGDWESALDAAAHVGNREIAELLIAAGARQTIFSAAMLGDLDTVRAMVTKRPGTERALGPHSLTLMAHARAGGPPARAVVEWLAELGTADGPLVDLPLEPSEAAQLSGVYVFGRWPTERLAISLRGGRLQLGRPGSPDRALRRSGPLEFIPNGAEEVRLVFRHVDGAVVELEVRQGVHALLARRSG